jgi:hypothetical protein
MNDWNHGAKGKVRDLLADRSTLDMKDLGWLRGLLDSGLDDASELIDAIHNHGTIDVRVSY